MRLHTRSVTLAVSVKTETASQEDDVNPRERLALNRILSPQLPLPEFLKLTADLGMKMAEIRNDFAERGVLDGLSETQLKKASPRPAFGSSPSTRSIPSSTANT